MESGIWENAQQIGQNDRAKTEGAYVALRVSQFEHLEDSQKTEHFSKPTAVEDRPTTQKNGRGFLPRLLGGEIGLAKTFWLFWFLPILVFTVIFQGLIKAIPSAPVIATTLVFFVLYKIVALRAVWLASVRYDGPRAWSFLAQVTVSIGVAVLISEIVLIFDFYGTPVF